MSSYRLVQRQFRSASLHTTLQCTTDGMLDVPYPLYGPLDAPPTLKSTCQGGEAYLSTPCLPFLWTPYGQSFFSISVIKLSFDLGEGALCI